MTYPATWGAPGMAQLAVAPAGDGLCVCSNKDSANLPLHFITNKSEAVEQACTSSSPCLQMFKNCLTFQAEWLL